MKTVRNEQINKVTLRLVQTTSGYVGLLLSDGAKKAEIFGADPEQVWAELKAGLGKSSAKYFGYDEALRVFTKLFPEGLYHEHFASEERDYKVLAKAKLDQAAPVELAAEGVGFGEAALAAIRGTNLIYPVEKARVQEMLRGPHADAFVRAAARFALGDTQTLADMERILKHNDNARWTVATYLPFLWKPESHMFLKPQVTVDYAERVGHPFAYEYRSGLAMEVYESLLDLTARTRILMKDLGPRDNIDIQSLIWVIGYYEL